MAPPVTKRAPVEAKVQAAGLSGAVAGIALWIMQQYVFKGSNVPAGLVSLIDAVVPGLVAFLGAWLAPHTPRPSTVQVSTPSPASPPGGTA